MIPRKRILGGYQHHITVTAVQWKGEEGLLSLAVHKQNSSYTKMHTVWQPVQPAPSGPSLQTNGQKCGARIRMVCTPSRIKYGNILLRDGITYHLVLVSFMDELVNL